MLMTISDSNTLWQQVKKFTLVIKEMQSQCLYDNLPAASSFVLHYYTDAINRKVTIRRKSTLSVLLFINLIALEMWASTVFIEMLSSSAI